MVPWRAQSASAGTGLNYTVVDADNDPYSGIYLRDGTSMANVRRIPERYMLYGTVVELICGTWGESVGPYANRRWHNVRVANGATVNQVGWIADRYVNTPNVANQPTPGEPECGATPPPPPPTSPPPPATTPLPPESANQPIWIGAPTAGAWPSSLASSPAQHWIPYGGQWGLDFSGNANKTANLYVAPKNNALNNRINTKVESSGPACKFRGAYGNYRAETFAEQIKRGGYKVVVGVYDGSTKVATITYAHLDAVAANGTIGRWGGRLGTVGTWTKTDPRPGVPTDTLCWDGAHVHIEPRNQSGNACYMKWNYGQTLTENTYLGYVGYSVGSTKTACPSGI